MTTTATLTANPVRDAYRRIRADHPRLPASQAVLWARSTADADANEWTARADALYHDGRTEWTATVDGDALRYVARIEDDDYPDTSWLGRLSTTWEDGAYDRAHGGEWYDRNAYRYVVPEADPASERSGFAKYGRHAADCAARAIWKSQRDALLAYADGEYRVVILSVVVFDARTGIEVGRDSLGGCDIGADPKAADVVPYLADSLRDVAAQAESEATDALADIRDR